MARWLRWLLALVAVVALAGIGLGAWVAVSYVTAEVDTVGEVDFDRPLAIPPLAESRVEGGVRVFELDAQEGETDLGRDEPTPTWGFDGSYLGPTLRATTGERVRVDVHNGLPETTTVHWHGMHLPARMDGGPHQPIEPGETWRPTWQVDQPAATLWYHPHPHGETAEHVYRGLAGMWLLDAPAGSAEAAVQEQLPHDYGVDDVPVIVQDKSFDGSELDESGSLFAGVGLLGDTILVNGTPGPYLDVTTERVRLRLLNASNARTYRFGFDDGRRFAMIASDGGLLAAPAGLDELWLSPGERAEVVVTMAPGEEVVLRSEATGSRGGGRFQGGDDRFDVMQLRAADRLDASAVVPERLLGAAELPEAAELAAEVTRTREFTLAGNTIDGQRMEMDRIDEVVELDTTERWVVTAGDGPHNFHVHDMQFLVESIDGEPPPAELTGWKDTVFLPQGTEAALLIRFRDYADPHWPYMFHCHLLRHEDDGLMGQFVVVAPGTPEEEIGVASSHDH